jgi:ADP-heptose:LPS heptosyltransferase
VADLLKSHPSIDEVIRVRKGFLLKPSELFRIRKELRARSFRLAIDPQGLAKSAVLTWLSGAPIRLGFDSCQAREGAHLFYTSRRHPLSQHLVERQLELLEMCNVALPETNESGLLQVDFGWNDSSLDSREVNCQMNDIGLAANKFFIMNPGAGWESKRWPLDRYAVLSEQLHEQTGLPTLVVWGGDREFDFARTIAALSPSSTIVAPPTTLVSLSQWAARAKLFIGSDTGPMHLAAAAGTPCIAMYGTSLPQHCGPYGSNHTAIQKRYDGGSSRYRRSTTNAAMKSIEVDDVLQACLDRLSAISSAARDATIGLRALNAA